MYKGITYKVLKYIHNAIITLKSDKHWQRQTDRQANRQTDRQKKALKY